MAAGCKVVELALADWCLGRHDDGLWRGDGFKKLYGSYILEVTHSQCIVSTKKSERESSPIVIVARSEDGKIGILE